ncbi:MAG: hypothetical protein JRN09_08610 [Nitrososphaerota archaeon]|nr:hypothetical protein [Nitrososphaerota archaeon]
MPDKAEVDIALYEVKDDFAAHIEKSSGRIKVLSVITLVISVVLLVSYFSQIVYPFVTGQTTVTVNLVDPSLLALEVVLVLLTLAWLYVGAVNLLFSTRMARAVKLAREHGRSVERMIEGGQP